MQLLNLKILVLMGMIFVGSLALAAKLNDGAPQSSSQPELRREENISTLPVGPVLHLNRSIKIISGAQNVDAGQCLLRFYSRFEDRILMAGEDLYIDRIIGYSSDGSGGPPEEINPYPMVSFHLQLTARSREIWLSCDANETVSGAAAELTRLGISIQISDPVGY